MNYEDFTCFVQRKLQEKLGEDVQVELHQIMKNNSVLREGLAIHEKENSIAPTIYLKEFYEEYRNGMTMPDILDYIEEVYQKNRLEEPFDTEFYNDFEKVRSHLACKVVNREKNRELLKSVPCVEFLDLAIVCYYRMEHEVVGNGTILVFESHRKNWGVSREELLRISRDNTPLLLPVEYLNMNDIVEIQGEDPQRVKELLPMYILTNRENYFGAVLMIYDSVLQEAGRLLDSDFWILPSSVHECILVPSFVKIGKKDLERMVRQVNEQKVAPEDYLSDSVYFYRRDLHKLEKV